MRTSTSISTSAAAKPAPAATPLLKPNGCHVKERAATENTNAPRAIHAPASPLPPVISDLFFVVADKSSACEAEESATSFLVRLIRPHRIPNHCKIEQPSAEGTGVAY